MIDIALLIGRIVFIAMLYIFLFFVIRTGVGAISGQRRDSAVWSVEVVRGPQESIGKRAEIMGPVTVGRSTDADIYIPDQHISGHHCRFNLQGPALTIEDLGSTNGTIAGGRPVVTTIVLRDGETVEAGDAVMKVSRR